MRVIIVARLSKQGRGDTQTGIETQDEYTRHWAESKGYKVVALIADKRSGIVQPWDRPNLKPWVTDPTLLAKYDSIVAYRLDRLSRGDNKSTGEIEAWAYKYGKQLLTEDGLVFPCEGAAGTGWDVTKRIAHEEWLKISERNTRMQAYLRQEGFQVGKAPTGYRIVRAKSGEHKTIEHNPNVAPYVRARSRALRQGWLDGTPYLRMAGVRGHQACWLQEHQWALVAEDAYPLVSQPCIIWSDHEQGTHDLPYRGHR